MKKNTSNFNIPKKLDEHTVSLFSKDKFFLNAENSHKMLHCYIHNSYPLYMHKHKDFFEINIITKGFGVHYINNKRIDVLPGSVFIISPNMPHGYINLGELKIFHLLLPNFFFEKFYDDLCVVDGFTSLFPKNSCTSNIEKPFVKSITLDKTHHISVLNNIDEILNYSENNVASNLLQTAIACQLILKLCLYRKNRKIKEKNNIYISLVLDAIHYMENNIACKITIDDICKKFYITKSTFIRAFTKYTCFTPTVYLTKLRIEKAKKLLAKTNDSITNIAVDCGFFDSSHFEKCFKLHEHSTPSYFRQKNQNNLND